MNATRRLLFAATIVWTSFFATAGQAIPLVDQGANTFDPNTGLRWLDVTLSQNRSYSDVSANFGAGGDFAGYRYATGLEVAQLWANVGITSPYSGAQNGEAPAIASLIALLGVTDTDALTTYTYGITADDHSLYPPGTLKAVAILALTPNSQIARVDHGAFNQSTDAGSFLVQDVSAVPLPAALPLFATVLAGGGLIAWRRKRKAKAA